MRADHRRLVRLQRLETVRGIAKMTAAREAAEAETTLSQLEMLAARTGRLVADYATRSDATDGSQLRQLALFRERLDGISRSANADAGRAKVNADHKMAALAEAERSRQAVEDRARIEAQAISQRLQVAPLGARRGFGTTLE
jgi:hypothetical protein